MKKILILTILLSYGVGYLIGWFSATPTQMRIHKQTTVYKLYHDNMGLQCIEKTVTRDGKSVKEESRQCCAQPEVFEEECN